jgi:predicted ATPase/class 3 adenylate cyclase
MATQVESGAPAPARPTGTVTFLFSDIEGSTVRWERYRDEMAVALSRHDALMSGAIETSGGYIFKRVGDAFCAAFATAADATQAACAAQRAIVAEDFSSVEDLRVRIALHTGSSDERDGDYFGPAVNRVARLLAVGHGGQVLLSGATAELLQGEMAESTLRDLGPQRLKDLARPEQVYQLVSPGLPDAFPSLRSLDTLPNNLPRQVTSFVGRDGVLAELAALIGKSRLVTLVGTGGAGKTRCAVQVGAELLDGTGDGVWFAELAPILDPALVTNVVAQVLNVQSSPESALITYLKSKRLLLILDNCEHVISGARRFASEILRHCPDVRILATSREGLNVAGEQLYRMPSLAVPAENGAAPAEITERFDAVTLFVDRACAADVRFALTDENAPHVAEICRRLDGIPLAIELAAARVKVLSPKQLAQKLDERFRLLTGGDRSALPRQQTMRALIDWSHDLLSDEERMLFRKLSIFAGGFALESATAVCSDGAIDEIAVLDLLSSLVDKSLVQAETVDGGTRYRLLESTRQYAREKLVDRGEYEATAYAHATAFLSLAEKLEQSYETTPDDVWERQALVEMENWRAALEWSLTTRGDVTLGRRLAGSMHEMWYQFAAAEGRQWVRLAVETIDSDTPDEVIAWLDFTKGSLDAALGQNRLSFEASSRALERFKNIDHALGVAMAQRIAGRSLLWLERAPEGEDLLHSALATFERLRLYKPASRVLMNLGNARDFLDDPKGAREFYARALASARASGSDRMVPVVRVNLAETEFHTGDITAALNVVREALNDPRLRRNRRVYAIATCNVASYLIALDRYDEAAERAREALTVSRDIQDEFEIAIAQQHVAAAAALRPLDDERIAREMLADAARLLGYVDARIEALDSIRESTEQVEYDRLLARLRLTFNANELQTLMAEGSTWSKDRAVTEALAWRPK